jgi:type II secretory pathway pseudopilin PulG
MTKNIKAQVWVETVTYTLIALVLIGAVLSFVKPKIQEIQDRAIIDQSVKIIEDINNLILSIKDVPGNQRLMDLGIGKGTLKIDGVDEKLFFEIESTYEYSEVGENYLKGELIILTEKKGSSYLVTLTRDYSKNYDIKFQNEDEIKSLTKSPTPYKILVSNKGKPMDKIIIDLEVV